MSLTDYIKNDLIAGFRAGRIDQEQLTLGKLSARYQVSITPVRAAVQQLIQEGVLLQQSNRRLTFCVDQRQRQGAPAVEPPKDWYRIVANDCIGLSLLGRPLLLREVATAEKYGISRSSLRHVLGRLAGEGVLDHLPRIGWRLRPLGAKELADYIEMRVLLERRALVLAWPHLEDAVLQAILDGNHLPEDAHDPPRLDDSLHEYLIQKADNYYITDFFSRHAERYKILTDWLALDHGLRLQAIRHHRGILTALLERDRTTAEVRLETHIRSNQQFMENRRDELLRETNLPSVDFELSSSDRSGEGDPVTTGLDPQSRRLDARDGRNFHP